MSTDFLYKTVIGRSVMKGLMKGNAFRIAAWFLNTGLSKILIPSYIKKNHIDMELFAYRQYDSFADFFSRRKKDNIPECATDALFSPCDGLLSIYTVYEDMILSMKGSLYRLTDLIPDTDSVGDFRDGLCLVFRLRASDYHHFHAIDSLSASQVHFTDGTLHSVQPIACETLPVYRLNRRWWQILHTKNFGHVAQIEIGAMMVGGVHFHKEEGSFKRGEEMGYFTLAGSTIVVLLNRQALDRLELKQPLSKIINRKVETQVETGEVLGVCRS